MERMLRQAHKVCDDPKLYLLIFHPRHTSHRIVYHASKHHTTPDMRSAISSMVQENFSNMPGCKGVVSHHKKLNCSWYHHRGIEAFLLASRTATLRATKYSTINMYEYCSGTISTDSVQSATTGSAMFFMLCKCSCRIRILVSRSGLTIFDNCRYFAVPSLYKEKTC